MMQFELLHVIFVTLLIPPHHIFASLEDNALSVEEQLNQHIRENGGEVRSARHLLCQGLINEGF